MVRQRLRARGRVPEILAQFATARHREMFAGDDYKIDFLPYHWGLNDQGDKAKASLHSSVKMRRLVSTWFPPNPPGDPNLKTYESRRGAYRRLCRRSGSRTGNCGGFAKRPPRGDLRPYPHLAIEPRIYPKHPKCCAGSTRGVCPAQREDSTGEDLCRPARPPPPP
ncbi:MAG: hypothetical protein QOE70_661 [Chthoniobacter sp.]|nr:hypothetical protein [Chthoniobacter sp.]